MEITPVLLLVGLLAVVEGHGHLPYCGSYCDADGVQHAGRLCRLHLEVCCGTLHNRYCCSTASESAHSDYRLSVNSGCPGSGYETNGESPFYGRHRRGEVRESSTEMLSRDCGVFCATDGTRRPPQICSRYDQWCCGTENDRTCCNEKYEWNPLLSVDDYSTCSSWMWYLEWWYVIVPLILISTLLITMTACYICRYRDRCSRRSRRGTRSASGVENVGLETPSTSNNDFDPSSMYAFGPPTYESLPKDPPTYMEIYHVYQNSSFLADTEQLEPPPSDAGDASTNASGAGSTAAAASDETMRMTTTEAVDDSTHTNDAIDDVPPPDYEGRQQ